MDTSQWNVEQLMETLVNLLSQWGLQVVGAVALFVVGRIACGWLRRATGRALERSKMEPSLVPFLSNMVYYLALAFVVIAVLNLFGIQTASIIAVFGAAGLAVGLAMQGTLSNFAAGVMLLIFRPFKLGEWIEAAGTAGTVKEISVFSTVLHAADNVRITIPNSKIWGDMIKNYSANPERRVDLVIGISYDDDIGKAVETIAGVLDADSRVLAEPAPKIAVSELGDSSVNLVVRPWCATGDYWAVRFDLMRALKQELEAAGCSIPYPQRDVHVHAADAAG